MRKTSLQLKMFYNSSTKHFTTAFTPKLHRDGNLSSPLEDELVERQCQLHACTHTHTHTHHCLRGMCPLRSWKFCIFETEIMHYGDISANLDQAMSKKKKKKKNIHAKK